MYTHTGMKGLPRMDHIDVDPILNRNRKRHACTAGATEAGHYASITYYKCLCGIELAIRADDTSAWADTILPASEGRRVTCFRCTRILGAQATSRTHTGESHASPEETTHAPTHDTRRRARPTLRG